MAPTKFAIILDNPEASYFPGQDVSGKVILGLNQEKSTQGLKIKFNGEAEVDWQESQGQSGSKGFHEKESYFHSKITLLGDDKNSDITIPEGEHEYPFSFKLPDNLPSSFEGPFGHVRYGIEAVVKRSWKFDYNTKILFTVNALVDLNQQRVYLEPREVVKEKSILCLCWKEGPISMRVELPRTAYVPGEFIKFSVHSSNSSSRPVSAIVVYFIRELNYRAQGRSKGVSEEMFKIRGPLVQPFKNETWSEKIQIPSVPPTNLGGAKIIELSYLLKFKLDIPSSIDLKKKLPIVIGSIPYTEFFADLHSPNTLATESAPPETKLASSTSPFPLPPALISQYPNMPLPIYVSAAVFDKEDDGKGNGDMSSHYTTSRSRPETPLPSGAEQQCYIPKYATYSHIWKVNSDVPDQNGVN